MTLRTYIEPKDIDALEEVADCLRDKYLIRLLFQLGSRISEALAITIDDIDLVTGTISIQHLKQCFKITCPICGARLGGNHTSCLGCGIKVSEAIKVMQEIKKVNSR